ncbi:hypothetical protein SERLA73DRAFT_133617, partial [Serpula lacrymans var. lacrymans S7.3]
MPSRTVVHVGGMGARISTEHKVSVPYVTHYDTETPFRMHDAPISIREGMYRAYL